MFTGCKSLKVTQNPSDVKFLEVSDTTSSNWGDEIFSGTGGPYTGNAVIGQSYYYMT